jgi:CheY-like chemotaxis protein
MTTVLLVDDVAPVRLIIRTALRVRGGFEVVAEAATGQDALQAAETHQPELVVLDMGLPDLAGREVLSRLRLLAPDARVVVFTGAESDRAVRSTADAYVGKDTDVEVLVDVLQGLSEESVLSDSIEIPADVREVREARRFVTSRCEAWGCQDGIDDASLIVSELVTNAIVHAGTSCRLTVRRRPHAFRLEVRDGRNTQPDPRLSGPSEEHGRGLFLVSATAVAWGIEPAPGEGKIVWAELLCGDDLELALA